MQPNHQEKQSFCICAKQNDDEMYVQCEDKCQWYHPKCIGLDAFSKFCQKENTMLFCGFCNLERRKLLLPPDKRARY